MPSGVTIHGPIRKGYEEILTEEALQFACAAGAATATRLGAQPSLPTRDEVLALL